jgi:Flp pilus assembly protein protease CpaA
VVVLVVLVVAVLVVAVLVVAVLVVAVLLAARRHPRVLYPRAPSARQAPRASARARAAIAATS